MFATPLIAPGLIALSFTADPIASLDEALVVPMTGRPTRAPFRADAIEAMIADGTWTIPRAGDEVTHADGDTTTWELGSAEDNGWLSPRALRNGYALWTVERDAPGVAMLQASGHSLVYVNGEPRTGDPYRNGWVRLPVRLDAGANTFLFRVTRGAVRADLVDPVADVFLDPVEATLPDLVRGETDPVRAGVLLVNATEHPMGDLVVRTSGDGVAVMETRVRTIEPLSTCKIPIWIAGDVAPDLARVNVRFEVIDDGGDAPRRRHAITLPVVVRQTEEARKRTFESDIDGSVQYYAVMPALDDGDVDPGLILTLHGASVEALGQARVYTRKAWAHVVAPTNRRPFGFDWEDWGRLDAMEVLERARAELGTASGRTWLTGHSMGGHGTWQLGVTFPGEWAAIAPSAGWESFWSYAGGAQYDDDPVGALLDRATAPSRTLELVENLLDLGVYILHGDADDNVPVDQARRMRDVLEPMHPDFAYHEQPGAGHWWGNQCCDWPPLMAFLEERERSDRDRIRFATMHPGVSATSGWVTIEQQEHPFVISRVEAAIDRGGRHCRVRTENVAALALRVVDEVEPGPLTLDVNGQVLEGVAWPAVTGTVRLLQGEDGAWTSTSALPGGRAKGPHRAGPFKDAFRHHAALVYGTQGTPEENAWSFAKARFDAETFWYRGNGAFEVMSDTAFLERGGDDRSVILYGNASTNAAWNAFLAKSPIQVARGRLTVGDQAFEGASLSALFVRPHPRSPLASVAAVAGTDLAACRRTDRLPYFVSGVAYPDWTVFGPEILTAGAAGVRGTGFFGADWGLESGEAAWRDSADE